ncbi:DUF4260 domain-containing protein [Variovorax ureilyticus]|uniref:DUF4260 domain-containing protein n=1 Tax=Variovorax ureilyticus TaxID=1836198 RepID=A0ABU8VCQ5_9BURK
MSYVPPSSGVSRAGNRPAAWAARRHAPGGAAEGAVSGGVRAALRLEGLAVLLASVAAYAQLGAGWGAFAMLFLVPDLSFLGYLAGARTGAAIYNTAHSYVGPVALLALGALADLPVTLAIGLIWCAHIGFDRMLGYGLKYASGLAATHLGRIGPGDPW